MAWLSGQTRSTLAAVWGLFLFIWLLFAGLVMGVTHALACGGAMDGPSAAGGYCGAAHDYFQSGEPGELTTALVYLWPLAALLGLGVYGVWNRSGQLLFLVATVASAAPALHLLLAFTVE